MAKNQKEINTRKMTATFILLWWLGLDYYERRRYFDEYKSENTTKARNPYELNSREIEVIYKHYYENTGTNNP